MDLVKKNGGFNLKNLYSSTGSLKYFSMIRSRCSIRIGSKASLISEGVFSNMGLASVFIGQVSGGCINTKLLKAAQ